MKLHDRSQEPGTGAEFEVPEDADAVRVTVNARGVGNWSIQGRSGDGEFAEVPHSVERDGSEAAGSHSSARGAVSAAYIVPADVLEAVRVELRTFDGGPGGGFTASAEAA